MRTRNTELLVWLWMTIWNTSVITTLDGLVMSTTIARVYWHTPLAFNAKKFCSTGIVMLEDLAFIYYLTCKCCSCVQKKTNWGTITCFQRTVQYSNCPVSCHVWAYHLYAQIPFIIWKRIKIYSSCNNSSQSFNWMEGWVFWTWQRLCCILSICSNNR